MTARSVSERRRDRRALGPSAVVAVVAVVLLGSAVAAARYLSAPPAVRLTPGGSLRYALAPLLAIPRLQASFVIEVLGSDFFSTAGGVAQPPIPAREERTQSAQRSPGSSPRPTPTPGLSIPVPRSDLSVSMSADRTTVRPAEDIVYTVVVTNVGRRDFRGELQWNAHTPTGTTFRDFEPPVCGDNYVRPNPSDPCVHVPVPAPGGGDAVHNPSRTFRDASIRSGESLVFGYRVTVEPNTPAGTRLTNHAHLVLPDPKTSGTVVVTVV